MSGYGVALVLAFSLGWLIIARESSRRGFDSSIAGQIVLAAAVGGFFGSKLYYAVLLSSHPNINSGGYGFWGGLVGAACAYLILMRLNRVSFFRHLDAVGIAVAAGYSVGRTGCWATGDDYGIPWNSPLAVRFPEGLPPTTAANMLRFFGEASTPGTPALTVISVHPTQLYEVLLGFAMFLILWRMRDHHHRDGWLFGMYATLAGAERFAIEFVRAKPGVLAFGLSAAQLVALAVMLTGLVLIYRCRRHTGIATYQASSIFK